MDFNRQGVEYSNAGNYDRAIESFNKALKLSPEGDALTFTNLGATYLKMNEGDKALNCFDKAINLSPDYANAWNMRGVLYFNESDFDKARENFQQAFKLNQRNETVLNNLAKFYEQTDNRNAEDWRTLGSAYEKLEICDKAVNCYDKALAISPADFKSLCNLGVLAHLADESDKAVKYFKKALEISPQDVVVLQNLGAVCIKAKKYNAAVDCLEKVLELDPKNVDSCYSIGLAHYRLGNRKKTVEYFLKALDISPNNAFIWRNLGDVYYNDEDYSSAIMCYSSAVLRCRFNNNPEDKTTLENLADCYEALSKVYAAAYETAKAKATTAEDELEAAKLEYASADCKAKAAEYGLKAEAARIDEVTEQSADIVFSGIVRNDLKTLEIKEEINTTNRGV